MLAPRVAKRVPKKSFFGFSRSARNAHIMYQR